MLKVSPCYYNDGKALLPSFKAADQIKAKLHILKIKTLHARTRPLFACCSMIHRSIVSKQLLKFTNILLPHFYTIYGDEVVWLHHNENVVSSCLYLSSDQDVLNP